MKKEAEFFHYEKCDTTTFEVLMLDKRTNRQQPSPLLYSIDIWPARNSRLTQRETNHYITCCTSELAWPYLADSSPEQLVLDLLHSISDLLYVVNSLE